MKRNFYTTLLSLIVLLTIIASCSKDGAIGPQGAQGPQGSNGAQGPKGDPGQDGTKFYSGNAAPSATTGVNGDFYINLSGAILYGPKTDSGWGNGVSLKGATGAAGANGANGTKIYSGTTPPATATGVAGDFYFDLAAVKLYGPKTAAGWGSGISLRSNSSGKSITAFSFTGLSPAVNATISEADKTVTLNVPAGTVLTKLVPTIAISDNATVSPASGVAQDFSAPVNYTVTAQDGSAQVYKVTVTVNKATTKIIDCTNFPLVWEDLGDGVDYIVTCNLSIPPGKVLTIKPGVTIQFDGADAGISISDPSTVNSGVGGLNMVGTAAKPIVLEGKTTTPGSWAGIACGGTNVNNQWEYVTVRDAGAGLYNSALYINTAGKQLYSQFSIKNCSFLNNSGYGISYYDTGYSPSKSIFGAFQNNNFANNSKSALKLKIADLGMLDASSSYNNNGQNFIEVSGNSGLSNDITVHPINVPYVIEGLVKLQQKMTILPGTSFQFIRDAGLYVSYLDPAGTIIANGTASAPIKFTPYEPNIKGYWFGIEVDKADPQTSFNYCIIDAGGSTPSRSGCAYGVNSSLNFGGGCNGFGEAPKGVGVVTNCTITNSGGYGLTYMQNHLTLSGNTFSGNTQADQKVF